MASGGLWNALLSTEEKSLMRAKMREFTTSPPFAILHVRPRLY